MVWQLLPIPSVDLRDGITPFSMPLCSAPSMLVASIQRLRPRVPRGLRALTAPARSAASGSCVMAPGPARQRLRLHGDARCGPTIRVERGCRAAEQLQIERASGKHDVFQGVINRAFL